MRRTLRNELEIDAPADVAWEVMTAFADYSAWNPVITQAKGSADFGHPIRLRVFAEGLAPRDLSALLLRVHPPRELLWIARTAFPGLLDIEYHAQLESLPGSRSRLIQELSLGGMLVLFVWRRVEPAADQALERFAHAFQQRCRDARDETVLHPTGEPE